MKGKLSDIVNKVIRDIPITKRERSSLRIISQQLAIVADIAKVSE